MSRRIGALLLLGGGAVDVARLVLVNAGVILGIDVVQLVLNFVPAGMIGVGLVALGFSVSRGARAALVVAGGLELLVVVVNAVQSATDSPFGPGPSQLTYYASFVAIVMAAVVLLVDQSRRGPIRWGLAIPAGCIVVSVISLFTLPVLWLDLLPGLGFAIAGVFLVRATVTERSGRPLSRIG